MNYATLKSDSLTVTISSFGAELQNVTTNEDTEFIWQGNKEIWSKRAPILFPVCGGLKENKFTYLGKEYKLCKHGFAQNLDFEIEKIAGSEAVFLLKSDEETLKVYPFEFEFRVIYRLEKNTLAVTYNVKNKTDGEMYFSVGAHEGYDCPDGLENYELVFEEDTNLDAYLLNGNTVSTNKVKILENSNVLPLNGKLFERDALVFRDAASKRVVLRHKLSSKSVCVDFPGHDYLLLWTKPVGKYLCIEPWCGIDDSEDMSFDITKKEGINKLSRDEEFNAVHTITFSK